MNAQWINTEIRRPGKDGEYICHFSDGTITGFAYISELDADSEYWGYQNAEHVTHWMEFPPPPKS